MITNKTKLVQEKSLHAHLINNYLIMIVWSIIFLQLIKNKVEFAQFVLLEVEKMTMYHKTYMDI